MAPTARQPIWLKAVCGVILAFLLLPCVIVLIMSFSQSRFLDFPPRAFSLRWFEAYLSSPEWRDATLVSFLVSGIATALAVPIGTAAACGLRSIPPGLARLFRLVLILPMMVPQILMAIGVFLMFSHVGLNNTKLGLILAYTMLITPFVIATVSSGLESADASLVRAARSLGASPLRAFLDGMFPQIKTSIGVGALFAFVAAFDEVLIALFISSGDSSTLPRRMFASIRDEIDPTIAAISAFMVITVSAVLLGNLLRTVWRTRAQTRMTG